MYEASCSKGFTYGKLVASVNIAYSQYAEIQKGPIFRV